MNQSNMSVRWAFNTSIWKPKCFEIMLAGGSIQEEEKERILRFVFQKDMKSSMIGRLLMRRFVSCNSSLPKSDIRFGRDERGKPFLIDGDRNLSFNVSHQGNFVVLAGETSYRKVGVDVMKIEYTGGKSVTEFFRIMTRHFSPEEWCCINGPVGASDRKKLEMFYRHWCLKESYVKATGTGITVNLQRLSFKLKTHNLKTGEVTTDTKLYIDGEEQTEWCFEESLLDGDHCVSVAVSPGGPASQSNIFTVLDFKTLMSCIKPLHTPDGTFWSSYREKEERPNLAVSDFGNNECDVSG